MANRPSSRGTDEVAASGVVGWHQNGEARRGLRGAKEAIGGRGPGIIKCHVDGSSGSTRC